MLAFVERFIARHDVIAVHWLARIRHTVDGPEFELPDGNWTEFDHECVVAAYGCKMIPAQRKAVVRE